MSANENLHHSADLISDQQAHALGNSKTQPNQNNNVPENNPSKVNNFNWLNFVTSVVFSTKFKL